MPLPSVYSEAVFANYLVSQIPKVAAVLGWDAGSVEVLEAVNDALLKYGTTDIAIVTAPTEIDALRALGRRAIWRAVVQATSGDYAFTDVAQQTFNRQQVNAQAREMLKIAESDCAAVGVGDGLSFGRLTLDFLEPSSEWA